MHRDRLSPARVPPGPRSRGIEGERTLHPLQGHPLEVQRLCREQSRHPRLRLLDLPHMALSWKWTRSRSHPAEGTEGRLQQEEEPDEPPDARSCPPEAGSVSGGAAKGEGVKLHQLAAMSAAMGMNMNDFPPKQKEMPVKTCLNPNCGKEHTHHNAFCSSQCCKAYKK